jgi:methylenetetrahydrofolate dehydrogenase (NADP+)/methenyltetrahydrofolate cyclohydrolase
MTLIDGKIVASTLKNQIADQCKKILQEDRRAPHLAAIIIGNDPASETYISAKEKACKEVGITSSIVRLNADVSEADLLHNIEIVNNNDNIDGLLVQLPLPKHINTNKILEAINPAKDVDGFHPVNVGKMVLEEDCFLPATPFGVVQLLKHYGIQTDGKNCTIVGRSSIVGTPLSIMLSRKSHNATVTLCHSYTKDLKDKCLSADILIAAIGKPGFITEDMVKQGATVVDVGIHRIEDKNTDKGYRIVGDVDFDNVAPKCNYITPVPGGVGAMTIVCLLHNVIKAYSRL